MEMLEAEIVSLEESIKEKVGILENALEVTDRISKRVISNEEKYESSAYSSWKDGVAITSLETLKMDVEALGLDSSIVAMESADGDLLKLSIESDKNILEKAWDAIKKFVKSIWDTITKYVNKFLVWIGLKEKKAEEFKNKLYELADRMGEYGLILDLGDDVKKDLSKAMLRYKYRSNMSIDPKHILSSLKEDVKYLTSDLPKLLEEEVFNFGGKTIVSDKFVPAFNKNLAKPDKEFGKSRVCFAYGIEADGTVKYGYLYNAGSSEVLSLNSGKLNDKTIKHVNDFTFLMIGIFGQKDILTLADGMVDINKTIKSSGSGLKDIGSKLEKVVDKLDKTKLPKGYDEKHLMSYLKTINSKMATISVEVVKQMSSDVNMMDAYGSIIKKAMDKELKEHMEKNKK